MAFQKYFVSVNLFFIINSTSLASKLCSVKNRFTETKYFWNAIIKKTETDTHYFLFENSLQAIIIPKRACKSEEEKLALRKVLSRNLSLDAEFNQILA